MLVATACSGEQASAPDDQPEVPTEADPADGAEANGDTGGPQPAAGAVTVVGARSSP